MPTVTVKNKCCQDTPRCHKCPVTCMRLEREGYAQRESKRRYTVDKKVPTKVRKRARAR